METAIKIFLAFAMVYGAYMILAAALTLSASRELARRGIIEDEHGNFEFFADAENAEFLVRCALWASTFERSVITVKINENDGDALETAEYMRRRHKNIVIRRV